ncbi:MAG: zinc-ribbon domain-containing protein, partial [Chloroflexota bacterium]|nr:zinc-ribbon domain-containing protein [Chloroflexota bacterium]
MITCPRCGAPNADSARFCSACGSPLATAAPAAEVRKTVTVLFCDVVGSTSLGEHTDPESLRRVMSRYFDEVRTVVERHGGVVEKFIGDAVMAVFGVPVVHEDDALRAVRAAVELRARLAELDQRLERERGISIAWRTGINTGEVVAGDAGAGQRFVTGDAVNVAARLEQAAQPGDILIGAETRRLVRDAVAAEPIEALQLRGKSLPVQAYRLLQVAAGRDGHA